MESRFDILLFAVLAYARNGGLVVMLAREMLKAALVEAGMTQRELAAQAGFGPPYVGDVILGNRPISVAAARKICPLLGLSPAAVLKQQVDDDLAEAERSEVAA